MKTCRRCGRELPEKSFYPNKRYKDGLTTICKECHRSEVKAARGRAKELKALKARGVKALADYTPRELMDELKKRGYRGRLEYTETHIIDFDKLGQ